MQTEDRRTDMTKLIVAFCTFANAPKSDKHHVFLHRIKCVLMGSSNDEDLWSAVIVYVNIYE
jgi:hypothetical protein